MRCALWSWNQCRAGKNADCSQVFQQLGRFFSSFLFFPKFFLFCKMLHSAVVQQKQHPGLSSEFITESHTLTIL